MAVQLNSKSVKDEFSKALDEVDPRLRRRLIKIADRAAHAPEASLPKMFGSWQETKSAYRFFANPRVDAAAIQSQHVEQTIERMKNLSRDYFVAASDTTSLNYSSHLKTEGLGQLSKIKSRDPQAEDVTSQGLWAQTTLILSDDHLPLGVLDQHCWSRRSDGDKPKRSSAVEHKESFKWFRALTAVEMAKSACGKEIIFVADREADINELYAHAMVSGVSFVIRSKSNRVAPERSRKLIDAIGAEPVLHRYDLRVEERESQKLKTWSRKKDLHSYRIAHLEVRAKRLHLHASEAQSQKIFDLFPVTVALVTEEDRKSKKPFESEIQWLLITNYDVQTSQDAQTIIDIYRTRWEIEIYHRILKSGCRVERCKLQAADKLERFIAVMGVIAWRIGFITHLGRTLQEESCEGILDRDEWQVLYLKIHKPSIDVPKHPPTLKEAVLWIARLGGYLGRKSELPPGPTVLWRGLTVLEAMAEGYRLARSCG